MSKKIVDFHRWNENIVKKNTFIISEPEAKGKKDGHVEDMRKNADIEMYLLSRQFW